jgi:NADH dehydrogenase
MQNPFVAQALDDVKAAPDNLKLLESAENMANPKDTQWVVKKAPRSGSVITDDRLRVKITTLGEGESKPEAIVPDVYALGDCGVIEGTQYPATAQVAQQKAFWLAKRLNEGDIEKVGFKFKNLGTLAYIGNWNALFQGGGGSRLQGYLAWIIWRGAYFTRTVSLRNKILIPVYWYVCIPVLLAKC